MINVVVFCLKRIYIADHALIGNASIKNAIKAIAKSFRFVDKPDTSSNGPGCLNIDMKTTKNAMNMNSVPERSKIATDANVKMNLNLLLDVADLAM